MTLHSSYSWAKIEQSSGIESEFAGGSITAPTPPPTASANQGDSENGLQSPQLMAIGHTCYDGLGISQVKLQCNICDHKASSDLQFTMEFTIGYNLVSDSNLS